MPPYHNIKMEKFLFYSSFSQQMSLLVRRCEPLDISHSSYNIKRVELKSGLSELAGKMTAQEAHFLFLINQVVSLIIIVCKGVSLTRTMTNATIPNEYSSLLSLVFLQRQKAELISGAH